MPKNKTVPAELRELRIKAKNVSQTKSCNPPSELYLSVLGNGSSCSSRALYLFTDRGRYLFNCGEGTQRLAHEYKMKLSKLDHIFITHKSWDNVGGLLGLSLTVQDIGVPEINLHGPPGTDLLFQNAGSFIFTKDLKIVPKNCLNGFYTDSCLEVCYIPIFGTAKQESPESSDAKDSEHWVATENKSKKLRLSNNKSQDVVIAYACKGHSKPGHLLMQKCIEYGVPLGPLLGELKNGKDVVLPSGKTVYSKDVVSEEQRCPVFLVVECPSKQFLDSFVNEEAFSKYQTGATTPSDIASLVVHFTPPNILKSEKYQQWITRFPNSTCHLIINNDNSTLISSAVHRIQHKLNLLHPEIFPLLQERQGETLGERYVVSNIIQANTLDRYYLRPAKGLDQSFAVDIDPKCFVDEAMKVEGFHESLKHLQVSIKNCKHSLNDDLYPEIVFLGTGSSIPSKVRNVSSILVRHSKDKYLFMDCGEGTCGQLMRMYGSHYRNVLFQLCCIFISHMHADHHLGLVQILKSREQFFHDSNLQYEPVLLVGPTKLRSWLIKFNETFEKISSLYRFLECSALQYDIENMQPFELLGDYGNCADIQLHTVPVNHCPDAYGAILKSKLSKWKLVYSGDTTPCEKLVIAGKDCSLLIHEATMEDELEDEAILKKHSTTTDAIKIGEKMNSCFTILTHFSQRYAKIPLFNENFHNHVGCAFDNMKICPKDLHILPLLIPTLKCLFADHVEELQLKGDKRRKKIELINSILTNSAVT